MNIRRSIQHFLVNTGKIPQLKPSGVLPRKHELRASNFYSTQVGHTTLWPIEVKEFYVGGKKSTIILFDGYRIPFDILPPEVDEHDYKTCIDCQKNISSIIEDLTPIYLSLKEQKLSKLREFKPEYFDDAPQKTAYKILYTCNHILNSYSTQNWYLKITDYIKWATASFGSFSANSGCGSLFLDYYFSRINHWLENDNLAIPKNKRQQITKFIDSYEHGAESLLKDINILKGKYEKWLSLFPFDLHSYFGNLKDHFAERFTQAIIRKEHNMYSGGPVAVLHTHESLLKNLWQISDELLDKISAEELNRNGVIPDFDKLYDEFLYAETKNQKSKLFTKHHPSTTDEREFIKKVKKWLQIQQEFWTKCRAKIIDKQNRSVSHPQDGNTAPIELKDIENNFDGTPIERVYSHFNLLVTKRHLSETALLNYLKCAFDRKENEKEDFTPNTFVLNHYENKQRQIYPIFHHYYSKVARKGKLKQMNYIKLLGDYFEGFDNNIIQKNFSYGEYDKLL